VNQELHDGGDFGSTLKMVNLKELKQYATEIIRSGAGLYDALAQEVDLREARTRAVSGHVDSEFVEQSIQEAIHQVHSPRPS
jgi:clusterin-associated protein 1